MVTVSVEREYGETKKITSLAWTVPLERKEEAGSDGRLAIFVKYVKLYCENSSLAGYKYLTEADRTWIERVLWITVHAITLCTMAFIVYGACKEYVDTPIVTMVDTDYYPVDNLKFPGVAICTINRISRQAAENLANDIFRANVTDQPYEEILDLISQFGSLYESTFTADMELVDDLDYFLRKYYNGDYDISNILYQLTPQCADILLKCRFDGEERNCSTLFMFRKTQNGFCCTFNYARELDDIPDEIDLVSDDKAVRLKTLDSRIRPASLAAAISCSLLHHFIRFSSAGSLPEKMEPIEALPVKDLGRDRGLTVVMEPFLDDYFYTMLPITGWKVTIFNPGDYPDETSGGVTEVLAGPLKETSLELDAVSFYSTDRVRSYAINKRKCIFPSEGLKEGYTYSDCIVDCKVEDIWQSCRCKPFFFPRRDSKRICNTADAPCLAKYKSKWWSIVPNEIEEEMDSLNRHMNTSWSLHCNNCYPACEDVHYIVRTWNSEMSQGLYQTDLLNNVTVADQAIVHIYFSKYGTIRLKQDVAYSWYDLMSNIGGICGVFIGFSLISVVELTYFSVLLLMELCVRSSRRVEGARIDAGYRNEEDEATVVRTIYWSELLPRTRISAEHDKFRSRKRVCY